MEKCVFIIEDTLKDLEGLFLALHELLLDATMKDQARKLRHDDLKLFFMHICWEKDAPKTGKEYFEKEYEAVRERVRKMTQTAGLSDTEAFEAEYCSVELDSGSYRPETCVEKGEQILNKMKELLCRELGAVQFPDSDQPRYAVLLDLILNEEPDKDLRWIGEGREVPSSWLYKQFTGKRCAGYSEYPPAPTCQKWRELAGMEDKIIPRERITRSRANYVPLESKLYQALNIYLE